MDIMADVLKDVISPIVCIVGFTLTFYLIIHSQNKSTNKMKDTRKDQIKAEIKNLQSIQSEIKKIIDDEELEPSDANEQLIELNKKLESVITNLGKV